MKRSPRKDLSEVSLLEIKSSAYLKDLLKKNGFTITSDKAAGDVFCRGIHEPRNMKGGERSYRTYIQKFILYWALPSAFSGRRGTQTTQERR